MQPAEHLVHAPETAPVGHPLGLQHGPGRFSVGHRLLRRPLAEPGEVRRRLARCTRFLVHKWYFDELYDLLWVRPVRRIAAWTAAVDKQGIDRLADGTARERQRTCPRWTTGSIASSSMELVNFTARWTFMPGPASTAFATGNVRQYVMWLVLGTVLLFVLANRSIGPLTLVAIPCLPI